MFVGGRLVEVRVPQHGGGSGYLLSPKIVLTAWHNVAPADSDAPFPNIVVRLQGEAVRHADLSVADRTAKVVWPEANPGRDLDFALLQITDSRPHGVSALPTEWASISGVSELPVFAAGYPDVAIDGARNRRDTLSVSGWIRPYDGLRLQAAEEGTLAIHLRAEDLPDAHPAAAWPGMSGAAVFARDRLVAIVGLASGSTAKQRLDALPVSRLLRRDDVLRCFQNAGDGAPTEGRLLSAALTDLMVLKGAQWGPSRMRQLLSTPARSGQGPVLRDALLSRLENEGRSRPGGVTAILAPTGYGKSTLAAQFASKVDGVAAFLREGERAEPDMAPLDLTFAALLRSSLNYPDELGDVDPPNTSRWMDYASRAARGDELLFAVVDGIDEATHPEDVLERLGLADELPPNLHLVLLGRPGAWSESWMLRRSNRKKLAIDSADQSGDIIQFVEANIVNRFPLEEKTLHRLSAEVLLKSNGSFLYVYYVLQDLMALDEPPEVDVWLTQLPVGLDSHYERHLWRKHITPWQTHGSGLEFVLRSLITGFQPMAPSLLSAIAQHAGVSVLAAHIEGAFRVALERYLRWEPDPNNATGRVVSFNHASIREFLAERYGAGGLAHAAFASFFRNDLERKTQIPPYGIRYAASHILEADDVDEAVAFLGDPRFIFACCVFDPSGADYLRALDELDAALSAGELTESTAAGLLRLALLRRKFEPVGEPDPGVLDWLVRTGRSPPSAAVHAAITTGHEAFFDVACKHADDEARRTLLVWVLERADRLRGHVFEAYVAYLLRYCDPAFVLEVIGKVVPILAKDNGRAVFILEVLFARNALNEADDLICRLAAVDAGYAGGQLGAALKNATAKMDRRWLEWAERRVSELLEPGSVSREIALWRIYSAKPDTYAAQGVGLLCNALESSDPAAFIVANPGPFGPQCGISVERLHAILRRQGRDEARYLAHWGEEMSARIVIDLIGEGEIVAHYIAACAADWSSATIARILTRLRQEGGMKLLEAASLLDGPGEPTPASELSLDLSDLANNLSDESVEHYANQYRGYDVLFEAVLRLPEPWYFRSVLAHSLRREREQYGRITLEKLRYWLESASIRALTSLLSMDSKDDFNLTNNWSVYAEIVKRFANFGGTPPKSLLDVISMRPNDGGPVFLEEEILVLLNSGVERHVLDVMKASGPKLTVDDRNLFSALKRLPAGWLARNETLVASAIADSALRVETLIKLHELWSPRSTAIGASLETQIRGRLDKYLQQRIDRVASRPLLDIADWRRIHLRWLADGRVALDSAAILRIVEGFDEPEVPTLGSREATYNAWQALADAAPAQVERLFRGVCLCNYYHVGETGWVKPFYERLGDPAYDRVVNEIVAHDAFRRLRPQFRMNVWAALLTHGQVADDLSDEFLSDLAEYRPEGGPDCNLLRGYAWELSPRLDHDQARRCLELLAHDRLWLPDDRIVALAGLCRRMADLGAVEWSEFILTEYTKYLKLADRSQFVAAYIVGFGADSEVFDGVVDAMRRCRPGEGFDGVMIRLAIQRWPPRSRAAFLSVISQLCDAPEEPMLALWRYDVTVGSHESPSTREGASGERDDPERLSGGSSAQERISRLRSNIRSVSVGDLAECLTAVRDDWDELLGSARLTETLDRALRL